MRAVSTSRWVMTAALLGIVVPEGASATIVQDAEVHPSKVVFAKAESWPAVAPGQHPIKNFQPFRAVYERVYRDANGRQRQDRVIITAERVAWGSASAIAVTLIDTGNLDFDDTFGRVHTRVFAEDDQRMLFQISPAPGSARDYLFINTGGPTARATRVADATGEGTVQTSPFATPQLGAPALWVVGSMALEEGRGIRFESAELPAASNILGARPFLVSGRETIQAGPAGPHEAWVVSYPLGMTSPRVMQNLLVDRPPYLLGKRPLNLESGETTEIGTLRLIEFTTFGAR